MLAAYSSELTTEVYGTDKTTAFRGGKGFSPEAIQDAGMRPYAPLLKEPMSHVIMSNTTARASSVVIKVLQRVRIER